MIYYSTVHKYLSFGDINGSTFIEAFVEVFNKHGKKEQLMDMVTRINQKIAALPPFQYIDPDTKSTHNAKQMPTIAECSLTKRIFFYDSIRTSYLPDFNHSIQWVSNQKSYLALVRFG
jgi:hypothetical protein